MYIAVYSEQKEVIGDIELHQITVNNDETATSFMGLPNYTKSNVIEVLTCFDVTENAILTDVMSISNMKSGFLISKKLKELIENLNIVDVEFIEARLLHTGNSHEYYWMNIYQELTKEIDYKKTKFVHRKNAFFGAESFENIESPSRENVLTRYKDLDIMDQLISESGYVFLNDRINNLDVYRIGHFDRSIYFSKNLKDEILNRNITGFKFIETIWR